MTNPKDPKHSKNVKTKEQEQEQEWEFDAVRPKIKYEDSSKRGESQVKNTHMVSRKLDSLILDSAAAPRTKTRSAMAMEMQGESDDELKDEFSLASYPKRAIALALDAIFITGLILGVQFFSPVVRKLVQYFLDSYKLQFLVPESTVQNAILGICGFLALFFLVVIPVAFFNTSLGKKIMGLRIRGKEKYTLSISEALKRELIMKPLSIVILAGFITPFFTKKRLSIHDMLTDTFVINDQD